MAEVDHHGGQVAPDSNCSHASTVTENGDSASNFGGGRRNSVYSFVKKEYGHTSSRSVKRPRLDQPLPETYRERMNQNRDPKFATNFNNSSYPSQSGSSISGPSGGPGPGSGANAFQENYNRQSDRIILTILIEMELIFINEDRRKLTALPFLRVVLMKSNQL